MQPVALLPAFEDGEIAFAEAQDAEQTVRHRVEIDDPCRRADSLIESAAWTPTPRPSAEHDTEGRAPRMQSRTMST